MFFRIPLIRIFTVLAILGLTLSACTPKAPSGPVTLKIAVLPILDTLPMYVAQRLPGSM